MTGRRSHPLVRRVGRLRSTRPPADGLPGSREYAALTRWRVEELERDVRALRGQVDRLFWLVVGGVVVGLVSRFLG